MKVEGIKQFWHSIPRWLRNPYLFALTFFAVWMLLFDENNFSVQWKRMQEVKALDEKIAFYEHGIRETKQELKELTTNPETQEKFARERYYMKRENEDVFVFRTFEEEKPQPKKWWQKLLP